MNKRTFTESHKLAISKACKGRKSWITGKKMPQESLYKNMSSHIRFDVSWEWLSKFDDIKKLQLLNRCISKRKDRFEVDTIWYKEYINRFYYDKQFNLIYYRWIDSGNIYLSPTIDHIIPRSKGGTNDLNNLQFLSWFENRCKNDMSQTEWDNLKNNIGSYFI